MNRKLQHTMTALSATAALLGLMLLAGAPPQPLEPGIAAMMASSSVHVVSIDEASDAAVADEAPADAARRSHVRRARTALALPYFSIAQGLRRATGS